MSNQQQHDQALRHHLLSLLGGQEAHISFASAVDGFPLDLMHREVPGLAHTAWDLAYHVHAAQRDILDYLRERQSYVSRPYPEGYWPRGEETAVGADAWGRTIQSYEQDRQKLRRMVQDPDIDLFEPLFPGTEHTLLREVLVLADHTSYHVGQIVDIRMLLGVPVRDY